MDTARPIIVHPKIQLVDSDPLRGHIFVVTI
jgi:hypothetical protein